MTDKELETKILSQLSDITTNVAVLAASLKEHKGDSSRRADQITIVQLNLQELKHDIKDFKQDFTDHVEKFDLHVEEEMAEHRNSIAAFKEAAFPNGDLPGHKVAHENDMQQRRETQEIKKDVVSHVLKGAFWAAAAGIFWAVMQAIKLWMNTIPV